MFDEEYLNIVKQILENEEFIKRKNYHHHYNKSVYDHSLEVSYKSYLIARKLHLDYKSTAIGGLLHDFYYKDWQLNKEKKKFRELHGFVHASEALENAKKFFPELIDKKTSNIIVRHMFPLNITPPKYKESWIVTIVDKACSMDVLLHPKEYPKYLGLKNIGLKKKKNML